MRSVSTWAAVTAAFGIVFSAAGQHVVGARPGLCSYARGDVVIGGEPVERDGFPNRFLDAGQTLQTHTGVAEVQLGSLSVVRAGAHSEIRLVSANPDHVELELIHGSVILDLRDRFDRQRITVQVADAKVGSDRMGVYRVDFRAGRRPRLKVFDGRATIRLNEQRVEVDEGKLLLISSALSEPRSFNKKKGDSFDGWATERRQLFARQAPGKTGKRRRGRIGFR